MVQQTKGCNLKEHNISYHGIKSTTCSYHGHRAKTKLRKLSLLDSGGHDDINGLQKISKVLYILRFVFISYSKYAWFPQLQCKS